MLPFGGGGNPDDGGGKDEEGGGGRAFLMSVEVPGAPVATIAPGALNAAS
jgi:hypothetical protein